MSINLGVDVAIPEIALDMGQRFEPKRVSSARDEDALAATRRKPKIARKIPEPVEDLFDYARLR